MRKILIKSSMTEDEKWEYILKLDEELLKGGIIISEWSTFLIKDAEIAFCKGAHLSSILSAQAAIESHLRYDFFDPQKCNNWGFYDLIEKSSLIDKLKYDLHKIRKYRNKWVHVNEPDNDESLLEKPEYYKKELEDMAKFSIRTMLEIIYYNQFV